MKLDQAKAAFIEERKQRDETSAVIESNETSALIDALELLSGYFSDISLQEITPARLREFLSRWYLEEAIASATSQHPSTNFPKAETILASLSEFLRWIDETAPNNFEKERLTKAGKQKPSSSAIAQERFAVLKSLQQNLPRAIEITRALSHHLAHRGGAFSFPEFLTSFEEGGQSEYDIGSASNEISAIEGYFKILRIDGTKVEAEELITERQVWPIIFPEEVARLLNAHYIINLELVCYENNWQIVNCGFAYPPNTDI